MSAPKFRRKRERAAKDWSNGELDELAERVERVEEFCEEVNDFLHTDDGGNDKLRNFFLKKFSGDPEMADLVEAATEGD